MQSPIRIPSSKGFIAAVLHDPVLPSEALAVLCPGYLDSKDYLHLVKLAEALCSAGYVVVRFDPTGTWDSDGELSDYTNTQYLDDIGHVISFMFSEKFFSRVLLGGHSRGAQIALLYASRDKKVSSVLAIMPSHNRVSGERRKQWEVGLLKEYRDLPFDSKLKKEFCVPFSHVIDRDQYDVLSAVAKISSPKLFVAGATDVVVPPLSVKQLYDAANEPKHYLLLANIGHDYRHQFDEVAFVTSEIMKHIHFLKTV